MRPQNTYAVVLFFAATCAAAQTVTSPGGANWGASLYSGSEASMQYAGERVPSNMVNVSLGQDTTYDDNIRDNAGVRQGDLSSNLGAHAELDVQRASVAAHLQYEPYFELYRKYAEYDRMDQQLAGDFSAALSERWLLRAREVFADQRGSGKGLGQVDLSQLGSPTALNGAVFVPFTPELDTSSSLNLVFVESPRTAVTVFGGYDQRKFSGEAASDSALLNTTAVTAGVQARWRATEHGELELLASVQRFGTHGTVQGGTASKLPVESAFGSFSWRLGPAVSVAGFFGPQYVGGQSGQGSSIASMSAPTKRLVWAEGGELTRQARRSSWFVSAQRLAEDGGGLLSFVTSSSMNAGVHRTIFLRWDATVEAGLARNQALASSDVNGTMSNESASCTLRRAIRNLNLQLVYQFIRQQQSGESAPGSFYRNQVGFGVSYQIRTIPLGR